jgi:excisionase family DNA binding protein
MPPVRTTSSKSSRSPRPSPPNQDSAEPVPRLDTPLLTPGDGAELLTVKPSWIYEAVRAGTVPCLRIGRHIRFTRPKLEDWLRGRVA